MGPSYPILLRIGSVAARGEMTSRLIVAVVVLDACVRCVRSFSHFCIPAVSLSSMVAITAVAATFAIPPMLMCSDLYVPGHLSMGP